MKRFAILSIVILMFIVGAAHATPARITDLKATVSSSQTNVILTFTMPAPGSGALTAVECRKSDIAITTLNWGTRQVISSVAPSPPGTKAMFNTAVSAMSTTYFGCKTKDTVWSAVSNVVIATTLSTTVTVGLAWDAVVHNEVVGYKMYIGDYSGTYASSVLLGLTTSTSLSLPLGPHCYVVHSRSNTTESGPSNEVCTP